MKTRIYNAKIITMVNGTDIIEGEIHIEDECISFVGTAEEAGKIRMELCGTGRLMPVAM